jgi:hypothetical protein
VVFPCLGGKSIGKANHFYGGLVELVDTLIIWTRVLNIKNIFFKNNIRKNIFRKDILI